MFHLDPLKSQFVFHCEFSPGAPGGHTQGGAETGGGGGGRKAEVLPEGREEGGLVL